MSRYGNENAAAGGRSRDTAGRDAQYGGGGGFGGRSGGGFGGKTPSKAGNPTVADHMIATGRISAPSIPSGGVARGNFPTQDDAYNDYAKSVGSYATRSTFGKIMDRLLGGLYDEKEPMAGNPRSFAGGDWHSSTNPAGVIGGIGSLLSGVPFIGTAAGAGYSALGLPDIWHGGTEQPDMRTGVLGNTDLAMGGTFSDIGSGHTFPSGAPPDAGNDGQIAGGGTGNGVWSKIQALMNAGQPQTSAPANVAPKPASAASPYQSLASRYFGVGNQPGMDQYGFWTPSHTYAA